MPNAYTKNWWNCEFWSFETIATIARKRSLCSTEIHLAQHNTWSRIKYNAQIKYIGWCRCADGQYFKYYILCGLNDRILKTHNVSYAYVVAFHIISYRKWFEFKNDLSRLYSVPFSVQRSVSQCKQRLNWVNFAASHVFCWMVTRPMNQISWKFLCDKQISYRCVHNRRMDSIHCHWTHCLMTWNMEIMCQMLMQMLIRSQVRC